MAFCQMIGAVAGDDKPAACKRGPSGHKTAIGLGVASLWLMNVSVNVVMGPARAIINDLVESSYLVTANSIATGVMGTSGRLSHPPFCIEPHTRTLPLIDQLCY